MSVKEKITTEPSQLFEDCVRTGGSVSADCELCGRTHFGNGRNMDEGQHESLQKSAKAEPDKYMEWDYDDVDTGHINGKQVVIGCPCNELTRFESFILSHRRLILKYLLEYSTERLDEASTLSQAAKAAVEAVEAMSDEPINPRPKRRFSIHQ